jgi:hypothetical protein
MKKQVDTLKAVSSKRLPLQHGGLFTKESFHPIESFDQVDLVILSNLQSFHSIATGHHDWTLRDVYMIPCVNFNTRANVSDIAVGKALGLFPHQLEAFHDFTGSAEEMRLRDGLEVFLRS